LKRIYWIPPAFFANRGPRRSRNPLTRIRNHRQMNGPSLVIKNTLIGLKTIGTNVVMNSKMRDTTLAPFWIPAGDLSTLTNSEIELLSESNLTLGPNMDWFDLDNINVISQLNTVKILVPHKWVISTVEQILPNNCQILVWHSGIDTDFWQKKRSDLLLHEVLVYVKNLNDVDNLRCVEDYLQMQGVRFNVLKYGSYSQSELKSILNRATAAIWIGGTESQGLALLECWSMNVPTLVLKNETWYSPNGSPYPASSAPYMSHEMGQFSTSSQFTEGDFKGFFSKLNEFSARDSSQKTFNLVDCASRLFSILEL